MEPTEELERDATTVIPVSGAARFICKVRAVRWARVLLAGLVVMVVLVGGSGIFSRIVVVSTKNLPARGRRTQINADLRNILTVAQAVFTDTGEWPESIEEMVNSKTADGKPAIANLEKLPRDPWGNEYGYGLVGGQARVTCLGSDHAPGGEGEAEDVTQPEPTGN